MILNRRILVLSALAGLILAAGLFAFKARDVEFLSYIVRNTLSEKVHNTGLAQRIQTRFALTEQGLKSGQIDRKAYRNWLLFTSAELEKVETLSAADAERLLQSLPSQGCKTQP